VSLLPKPSNPPARRLCFPQACYDRTPQFLVYENAAFASLVLAATLLAAAPQEVALLSTQVLCQVGFP